jgi:hypothetical protein
MNADTDTPSPAHFGRHCKVVICWGFQVTQDIPLKVGDSVKPTLLDDEL